MALHTVNIVVICRPLCVRCASANAQKAQTMRRLAHLFLIILAMFAGSRAMGQLLPHARALYPFEQSRRPIIESGFSIARVAPPKIYWLDAERVLFWAARGLPPTGKHGSAIYLWDLPTNSVSLYAEGTSLCYFQGVIRYVTWGRGDQAMIAEGRFGEETIRPRWPEDEKSFQSPIDCRVHPYKTRPQSASGHPLEPLVDGYGFLDFGNRLTAFPHQIWPIVFLPELQGAPVTLPIEAREVMWNKIEYAAHLRAHVLYGHNAKGTLGSWPRGLAQPIYLLNADGTVQIRHVPYGPWIGANGVRYASPTTGGLFFTSHQVAIGAIDNYAYAGAYVVEDRRLRRLISGIPQSARVSPDGCRAAWALLRYPGKKPLTTMQAVDLCDRPLTPAPRPQG